MTHKRRRSATKSSESMRRPWATLMLKRTSGQEMSWGSGLTNPSKKIRADQHSRRRHRNQLVAMPDSSTGSVDSRISLTVTERETNRCQASRHLVVRFHISGLSRSVSVLHSLVSRRTGLWSAQSSWSMMTLLWWRRRVTRRPAGSPTSAWCNNWENLSP